MGFLLCCGGNVPATFRCSGWHPRANFYILLYVFLEISELTEILRRCAPQNDTECPSE